MFVHSADKLAKMRTKFHVIQAKLIMLCPYGASLCSVSWARHWNQEHLLTATFPNAESKLLLIQKLVGGLIAANYQAKQKQQPDLQQI